MALGTNDTTWVTREVTQFFLTNPVIRNIFITKLQANESTTKTDVKAVIDTVMDNLYNQTPPTILP